MPYPTVAIALLFAVTSFCSAAAYTNHTVGGLAGWHFNATTNISAVNYSSWAAANTFSLGDFLVFDTISNQTVIQTYNETTYRSCSTSDAEGDDTFQYQGGETEFGQTLTVAVPLTIEGANYYFSDADDGVQCQQGMAFSVNVTHGQGLPPSLNQPPPPMYTPPPTASSPPVTVDDEKSESWKVRSSDGDAIVRMMVFVLTLAVVM